MIRSLILAASVLALCSCATRPAPSVDPPRAYRIASGSMAPALNAGDVVICYRSAFSDLRRGDVVAYRSLFHAEPVVHRLIHRRNDGHWVVKGDANPQTDIELVGTENYIGRIEKLSMK